MISSSGLEKVVHDCMETAADEMGVPSAVTVRLIGLADDVAAGTVDPTKKSDIERRIELVIKGYDTAS